MLKNLCINAKQWAYLKKEHLTYIILWNDKLVGRSTYKTNANQELAHKEMKVPFRHKPKSPLWLYIGQRIATMEVQRKDFCIQARQQVAQLTKKQININKKNLLKQNKNKDIMETDGYANQLKWIKDKRHEDEEPVTMKLEQWNDRFQLKQNKTRIHSSLFTQITIEKFNCFHDLDINKYNYTLIKQLCNREPVAVDKHKYVTALKKWFEKFDEEHMQRTCTKCKRQESTKNGQFTGEVWYCSRCC